MLVTQSAFATRKTDRSGKHYSCHYSCFDFQFHKLALGYFEARDSCSIPSNSRLLVIGKAASTRINWKQVSRVL